jgi:hypothetical protein
MHHASRISELELVCAVWRRLVIKLNFWIIEKKRADDEGSSGYRFYVTEQGLDLMDPENWASPNSIKYLKTSVR